jgi:polar amino acid transport system substrate-binding protein
VAEKRRRPAYEFKGDPVVESDKIGIAVRKGDPLRES